jgi:hypothetical protein
MKFERGIDPKKSMQIGIFSPKYFQDHDEARKWVMQNHVAILELNELCFPYPTPEQFQEILNFVNEYIMDPLPSSDQYGWDTMYIVDGVAQLYHDLNGVKFGSSIRI